MKSRSYLDMIREILDATSICDNLTARAAVVLERIARGGGAFNLYYCQNEDMVDVIGQRLSPGSVVSFYFDNRIQTINYSPEINEFVDQVIRETLDCLVGVLAEDGIGIETEIVTGQDEFAAFVSSIDLSLPIFCGAFPARDNDGKNAITVILPDADGVVRSHPH